MGQNLLLPYWGNNIHEPATAKLYAIMLFYGTVLGFWPGP